MAGFSWARNSVYRLRERVLGRSMNFYSLRFAMLSDVGRVRKGNEDACAASRDDGVFVVCDGMGGAAAGEVASKLAATAFLKALAPRRGKAMSSAEDRLDAAVHAANKAVYQHARGSVQLRGMGTTLVGLLVEVTEATVDRPTLTLVHVGDSRCYRWRGGMLKQLTQDHSLVEEQVRLGELTPDEAAVHPMRNIITRAVGSQPFVEPEITPLEMLAGDWYLLASDGLTRELKDGDIASIFARGGSPESLCQALIEAANEAGGGDNITVLLVQLP